MGGDIALHRLLFLCCITLLIHAIPRSEASQPSAELFLGVSPQDVNYYRGLLSSSTVKCKDGSKKFDKSQLNDDFCDCPDGSDEPGTSACPNGRFYCKNAGHIPVIIYSSRVNDGICDCCDGSDEYYGKTKCPNTCWEAGKAAREKLKKKISTYKDGIALRNKEIEQAKLAIAKDEGELSKLKDEEKILRPLVDKLKERKEQIDKVEEEERQRKEKEEKERQQAQESEGKGEDVEPVKTDVPDNTGITDQIQKDLEEEHRESVSESEPEHSSIKQGLPDDEVEGVGEESRQGAQHAEEDSNVDGKEGVDTGIQDENGAEDGEPLSREELGRRIASRWTGEKAEHHMDEVDDSSNKGHEKPDETYDEVNDEEDNKYVSDDDEHKYEDDDVNGDSDSDETYDHTDDLGREDHYDPTSQIHESDDESELTDITGTGGSSWLEKIQNTVKNIFQAVNLFQKPVNISDAAHIRKEYDEANAKLSKIQSRISKLTQKLGYDFGPEKEFYSFYGQCFESKQNKYVYKVCPFKQATQEEGYTNTRLGSWDKFEDSYRVMQFRNGDKCWNGPDRSLKVKLRCGLKNELADVDEPSRCEYLALLSTPAVCVETKLKELEEKLEVLNKEEPRVEQGEQHDEL
ncbi:glucosidase 2 subunit beta [Andrographis paniculata]|uniref:glucosidase 2 subunit beta n=1 Tax=Andrographis paniculata TaxID=175694 RepID=UPI0021E8C49E|nr:glucosidase 2 subunit beta [Andrographis paniculata]